MRKEKVTRKKEKVGGLLALLFAFSLLPFAFRADAAAPPMRKPVAKIPEASDQLDYVFFASDRPVLIRMHVRAGEKPYSQPWEAWMDKMFAWFDKDGNGFLDAKEAGRIQHPSFLQISLQGGIGGGNGTVPFSALDTNKDGKVSKEEFRDYYRKNGIAGLRFSNNNYQATQAKQTNDAIYKRLSVTPTGKMTRDKMARLPDLLRTLDENEDELLTAQELALDTPSPYGVSVPVAPSRRMGMQPAVVMETGLIEIGGATTPASLGQMAPRSPSPPPVSSPGATTPASLVQMLMTRYDKNKDGKLSRTEIGLEAKLFDQLDTNHDGFLNAAEMAAFFKREPDLVFQARVGKLGAVASTLARFGLSLGKAKLTPERAEVLGEKTHPMAKKVRRVNGETLAFGLGDTNFDLQANEGQNFNNFEGIKQFYLQQQFDVIVDKKKGYIEKKQERANAMNPFLFQIFDQADQNADGKLTRKELEAYLNLIGESSNAFVTISVDDLGRSLFNVIDTNGDGRLSIREMRTAWDRIKPLCKDGAGLVQTDLKRTLHITMSQGNGNFRNFAVPVAIGGSMMAPRPTNAGPLPVWFVKMDRNGDGDISPKEWLGTEEEFRMLDTDGDGLISGDEARQYEARQKKKDASKKTVPAKKAEVKSPKAEVKK